MDNKLNLDLIENKKKKKNNSNKHLQKLKDTKVTLIECLDYIIDNEIITYDEKFLKKELIRLFECYLNVSLHLNKYNSNCTMVKSILNDLIDNVTNISKRSKSEPLEKFIEIVKRERTKLDGPVNVKKI
tara:strand:- start:991 stop:1377 length:387 start_codon:yes stop_codon:yes gene_type:complete